MDLHALKEKLDQYEGQYVKVAITDIDGVLRGKLLHKEKIISSLDTGLGFCDVVFGWDINDTAYTKSSVTGWHSGYPDATYHIDPNTLRAIPWERNTPFLLGDFSQNDHPACPRNLLKKIEEQVRKAGYETKFAQEFEWFNFEKNDSLPPTPITQGMFGYSLLRLSQNSDYCQDLCNQLNAFDVSLEGLHTETGPGVYEACIQPDTALAAADKANLFKSGVKEIAYRHGFIASFMAKWNIDLPGCGGHIHQSLWKGGQNVFHNPEHPDKLSDTMQSYLAGQLALLPDLMPLYAPTINSYKRLVEGAWAPTTITWGKDNRTTACRVINGIPKSTRLEMRVSGADVNPYLAMAAALASGLYGIEQKLKLDISATSGNGYHQTENGVLPKSLGEATQRMKNSKIAREILGPAFIEHFAITREWEIAEFEKQVTDWELKRYFEII